MQFGTKIPPQARNVWSIIGEITKAPAGNVILRVGRALDGPEATVQRWEQTEHVVLEPIEARHLASALIDEAGGEIARIADEKIPGVAWVVELDPILATGFLVRRLEGGEDAIVEGEIEARSEAIARAAALAAGDRERI